MDYQVKADLARSLEEEAVQADAAEYSWRQG